MIGRRAGSAAQATGAEGCSAAHATSLGGSRPMGHALGVAGPIDGLRGGGVAFRRCLRRVPLAGSGRPLPGEVTSWT
jgi:hypothetical protein